MSLVPGLKLRARFFRGVSRAGPRGAEPADLAAVEPAPTASRPGEAADGDPGRLPSQLGLGFGVAAALLVLTFDRATAAPVALALAHIGIVAVAGWCFGPTGRWATMSLAVAVWMAATLAPVAGGWSGIVWPRVARDVTLRFAALATVLLTVGLARRAVRGLVRAEDALALTLLRERDSARRDRLTRLWNTRYLHEALEQEIARCRRYGRPFGLLILDLDGFKEVNDSRGHATGDQVLQVVGRILRENCRVTDVPARLGGDEFAVVLPEASALTVPRYAAKLVELVARAALPAGCPPVTASVGAVTFERPPESAKAALAQADGAMYAAKRDGKNRHAAIVAGRMR